MRAEQEDIKTNKTLPQDWVECELGQLCDFVGGGTPSKSVQEYWGGRIPWASIKDIKDDYLFETKDHITQKGLENSSTNVARTNEIILATRITPGRPVLTKIDTAINQDLKIIRPIIEIDVAFFYWLLRGSEHRILKLSRGTTVLGINLNNLKAIVVKMPPLPIQRALVKKIESLFSSLDSGITDLKKAQEQLKIYRQAVLKKAFEESAIIKESKQKLIDITDKIGSGATPSGGKKNYKKEGIPLIRSLNIHSDFIKYDDLAFIDETQAAKLDNVIVQEGDVLLNITGASIGRVNIAPKAFHNGRVNQHVSIIRPKKDICLPIYLKYFLQSPLIQQWISNINYGVTRQALTKSAQENLELPLPPVENQKSIVREIESRLSVCDAVEKNIADSLEKAESLRQSILKKAFEGKLLTPAEIAECKKQPDYESAEKLLGGIKGEKYKK